MRARHNQRLVCAFTALAHVERKARREGDLVVQAVAYAVRHGDDVPATRRGISNARPPVLSRRGLVRQHDIEHRRRGAEVLLEDVADGGLVRLGSGLQDPCIDERRNIAEVVLTWLGNWRWMRRLRDYRRGYGRERTAPREPQRFQCGEHGGRSLAGLSGSGHSIPHMTSQFRHRNFVI